MLRVEAVAEDVQLVPVDARGELRARDELEPEHARLVVGLGEAVHAVVVGEREHLHARRMHRAHELAHRQAAVGHRAVHMQVATHAHSV